MKLAEIESKLIAIKELRKEIGAFEYYKRNVIEHGLDLRIDTRSGDSVRRFTNHTLLKNEILRNIEKEIENLKNKADSLEKELEAL